MILPFSLFFISFSMVSSLQWHSNSSVSFHHHSFIDEPVPKEPHWWNVFWLRSRLQELRVLLPSRIYRILSSDPQLPFVLKESLVSAFNACRQSRLQSDEQLSCNVQKGRPYGNLFKNISAYDSRDFSFLLALTSAFAVRSIVIACEEGRLKKCGCEREGEWAQCNRGSHNLHYALQLSRKLMDRQYECVVPVRLREVISHNISVGRTRVTLSLYCSCNNPIFCHKTCRQEVVDEDTIIKRLRASLWNSRRIRRSNDVQLAVKECTRKNGDKRLRKRSASLWFVEHDDWRRMKNFYLGVPE